MQRPRILHRPPSASRSSTDTGQDAVDLAAVAGLELDPWQQFVLVESLAERPDGKWSAFECALLTPRQCGKNAIIEARELVGLFLLADERLIVHTAHEFKTAKEHFYRIAELIRSCPALYRRVKDAGSAQDGITSGNDNVGIELKDGSRLVFKARSTGSGRGFTGDLVVLDEAYDLTIAQMRALLPTVSARPNPQIWYLSTAVDQTQQPNSVVLAKVRERGMDGDSSRLFFAEWSVDETLFWDDPVAVASDPEMWAQAIPALGIRIPPEHVAAELNAMDLRSFGVERLGVGDWPSTTAEDEEDVIDPDLWKSLADVRSAPDGPVAFAVHCSRKGEWTTIAAAGERHDGRIHVEVTGRDGTLDHRRGTRWAVPRLVELVERHNPCAVMVDGGSSASLIPDLERAGLKVVSGDPNPAADEIIVKTSASDMKHACARLMALIEDRQLRHIDQAPLNSAVVAAGQRNLQGGWAWDGPDEITPLVAATLAAHGVALFADGTTSEPFVMVG